MDMKFLRRVLVFTPGIGDPVVMEVLDESVEKLKVDLYNIVAGKPVFLDLAEGGIGFFRPDLVDLVSIGPAVSFKSPAPVPDVLVRTVSGFEAADDRLSVGETLDVLYDLESGDGPSVMATMGRDGTFVLVPAEKIVAACFSGRNLDQALCKDPA